MSMLKVSWASFTSVFGYRCSKCLAEVKINDIGYEHIDSGLKGNTRHLECECGHEGYANHAKEVEVPVGCLMVTDGKLDYDCHKISDLCNSCLGRLAWKYPRDITDDQIRCLDCGLEGVFKTLNIEERRVRPMDTPEGCLLVDDGVLV